MDSPATSGGRRRQRKALRRLSASAVAALAVGVVVAFLGFARTVVETAAPADPRADGIVVLTGGAARIDGALRLLADGRATRLLISGVNPAVSKDVLAGTVEGTLRSVIDCCVDVDNARDTIENAAGARRWAADLGFGSLIVVTSDYHMPRTMAELGEAMPEVALIPFPVSNPDLRLADWWRDRNAFILLAREFGKYLVAEARNMLPGWASASAATN